MLINFSRLVFLNAYQNANFTKGRVQWQKKSLLNNVTLQPSRVNTVINELLDNATITCMFALPEEVFIHNLICLIHY